MTVALNAITGTQVLAVKMHPDHNRAGFSTIREYLVTLARQLWFDDNCNGKRPLGDSGWRDELYIALGAAGMIDITYDADGWVSDYDTSTGNILMIRAFDALYLERVQLGRAH